METRTHTHNKYLQELAKRAGLTYADLNELTGIPIPSLGKYLNKRGPTVFVPVDRYDAIETACKERIKENQKFIRRRSL